MQQQKKRRGGFAEVAKEGRGREYIPKVFCSFPRSRPAQWKHARHAQSTQSSTVLIGDASSALALRLWAVPFPEACPSRDWARKDEIISCPFPPNPGNGIRSFPCLSRHHCRDTASSIPFSRDQAQHLSRLKVSRISPIGSVHGSPYHAFLGRRVLRRRRH